MKTSVLFISSILFVLPCSSEARTWTNQEGVEIEAELVRTDGDEVIIRRRGKEYRLPIDSLSDEDQAYLRETAEKASVEGLESEDETSLPEAASFPLKVDQWVSGDKIDPLTEAGRPLVIHQWQAHCGACPSSLQEFEKIARRKKSSGALFMIWHSSDKIPMAQGKSDQLDLRLPIYHGRMLKWDQEKFGKPVWPHVLIMRPDGEVVYMGKPDRDFNKKLKELTADS